MKKIISALIFCIFISTSPKTYAFDDVYPHDWYYSYIITMAEEGLVEGYEDNTFRPDDKLTMAEFSAMLANAFYGASMELVSQESFGEWWEPYVYSTYLRDGLRFTTVDLSIQDYFDRGYLFNRWEEYVHQPLSRYDMASMVSNVLVDRYVERYSLEDCTDILSGIGDVDSSSAYAVSVAMAFDAGLVSGKSLNNDYEGTTFLTRAEAAVVLKTLMEHEKAELERYTTAREVLDSQAYNVSSYNLTGHIAIENYIFARTNELRVAKGLPPVEHRDVLVNYALVRSTETKQVFSHTRPDGTPWSTVFPDTDLENNPSGENLTMGAGFQYYEFADMIFKAWLNSPGHYANMLDTRHTTLGIAVYVDDRGAYYATQLFGR